MNATDGCYKTWKYTAAHLTVLHDGYGREVARPKLLIPPIAYSFISRGADSIETFCSTPPAKYAKPDYRHPAQPRVILLIKSGERERYSQYPHYWQKIS